MNYFTLGMAGMGAALGFAASIGQAETPRPVSVSALLQPARLLSDEAGLPATSLPEPPMPNTLAMPPWLLPTAPNQLDTKVNEYGVQLATATEVIPRRAAALYAQAEKLAAHARSRADLSRVIELCVEGLAEQPGNELKLQFGRLAAWAYNHRGEHLIDEGDERAAFDDFTRAINVEPSCWSAYQNRAITYATYGQHEEALRDFATAIELNPDAAGPYRNRSELQIQLGRWQAAEEDLSAAIARAPNDGDLRCRRGEVYQRLNRPDLAAREFDSAVALGSESASTLAYRAGLAAKNGNYDQAIIDYDAALRLDPYHAATYQGVAWLLATCPEERYRDPPKALEAARRAQRFGAANDPAALDSVAAAHANAGDYAAAVQYARQAVAVASPPLRTEIERRLALYSAGQPYRSGVSR